ncbi:MAG: methyltransferase domain-containing protein [Chloroflexota bacterium]
MKKLILRTANWIFDLLPPKWLITTLFRIDRIMYYLQQQAAGRYGGGIHPKHRLMNFHQFFTHRIEPYETVLDIGCGVGVLANSIAQTGAKVTGIDFSEKNLNKAKDRFDGPNIKFVYGDVLKTEFHDPFDAVVMSNVLEHLPGRPEFLRRVTSSVKPKRFLIRVPLFERDWRVALKKELGVEYRLDPTHEIEYTQEGFAAEMADAGLEITYMEIRWGEIWAELRPIGSVFDT